MLHIMDNKIKTLIDDFNDMSNNTHNISLKTKLKISKKEDIHIESTNYQIENINIINNFLAELSDKIIINNIHNNETYTFCYVCTHNMTTSIAHIGLFMFVNNNCIHKIIKKIQKFKNEFDYYQNIIKKYS